MIHSYKVVIASMTLIVATSSSAGVADWVVSNTKPSDLNQEKLQVMTQEQMVSPIMNREEKIEPATVATQAPKIKIPMASVATNEQDSSSVATEAHLSKTTAILNRPEIQDLKSDDYIAVVMLNSALVQAGLEIKMKTANQTTSSLYRSAVGCINSKNSKPLTVIAQQIVGEHQRLVDLSRLIKGNPSLGSTFTASCT